MVIKKIVSQVRTSEVATTKQKYTDVSEWDIAVQLYGNSHSQTAKNHEKTLKIQWKQWKKQWKREKNRLKVSKSV